MGKSKQSLSWEKKKHGGIANRTIWNVPEKTDYWWTKWQTSKVVDDRNIARAMKKNNVTNLRWTEVEVSQSTIQRRLQQHKCRGHATDTNHSTAFRIWRPKDVREQRLMDWWEQEEPLLWRMKGSAHDPEHTSSSVKYSGGGIMARGLHSCLWNGLINLYWWQQ